MSYNFSKIKIGTRGIYNGMPFSVIGRIKINYIYGYWNEWKIKFENSTHGWLSDILGQYSISIEYSSKNNIYLKSHFNTTYQDNFDISKKQKLKIDEYHNIGLINYLCTKITDTPIELIEGNVGLFQNELSLKIINLNRGTNIFRFFLTTNQQLFIYTGENVDESNLNLFKIQTLEDIYNKTHQKRGKLSGFSCPSCDSPNPKVLGVTNIAYCRVCNLKVDISNQEQFIIEQSSHIDRNNFDITLQTGNTAIIDGKNFIIVGIMLKEISNSIRKEQFVEYFLYQEGGCELFKWIVENRTTGKWYESKELNIYKKIEKEFIYLENTYYNNEHNLLKGRTMAAWGCFPFDVLTNNTVDIIDYNNEQKSDFIRKQIISNETTYNHKEIIFQYLKEIPVKTILKQFDISLGHIVKHKDYN